MEYKLFSKEPTWVNIQSSVRYAYCLTIGGRGGLATRENLSVLGKYFRLFRCAIKDKLSSYLKFNVGIIMISVRIGDCSIRISDCYIKVFRFWF